MDFEKVKIIETHCHVDVEIDGHYVDAESMIDLQRQEGLSYSLLIGGKGNRDLVERVKSHQDVAGVLLFIDPRKENAVREIEELAEAFPDVVKGVKLMPLRSNYMISTPLLRDVFACAIEHNLTIVTHTEADGSAEAGRYKDIMRLFPHARLVLYHACPADEAFALVNAHEHVFIDTSYFAWGRSVQNLAMREIGKERIVFGIDSPYGFPIVNGTLQPHYRAAVKDLYGFYDHDDDVLEHVLFKNAVQLFGLNLAA